MLDGETGRGGAGWDVELGVHRAQVLPDRARTDREASRDFRVRQPVGDEA